MKVLRNLLAIVGLVTVVGVSFVCYKLKLFMGNLDPDIIQVYQEAGSLFLKNLDPGESMVIVVPAKRGMTPEEVTDSLKSLAVQNNMLFVGESPFYKQVEAVTGKPYRFVSFLSFCDARVGMLMADYNDVYTAFMPCRIAVVQDKKDPQQIYLMMMNLDMLIHGGKPLPPELKAGAIKVSNALRAMITSAAQGQF